MPPRPHNAAERILADGCRAWLREPGPAARTERHTYAGFKAALRASHRYRKSAAWGRAVEIGKILFRVGIIFVVRFQASFRYQELPKPKALGKCALSHEHSHSRTA